MGAGAWHMIVAAPETARHHTAQNDAEHDFRIEKNTSHHHP